MSALQARFILCGLSRPRGEILFFAPPKKRIQKKGGPKAQPAARVPCASRENRRMRNSQSRYAR
ncbi:MAG: hypothetical protein WBN57_10400, partial [Gammaproteobacteria bacterium]